MLEFQKETLGNFNDSELISSGSFLVRLETFQWKVLVDYNEMISRGDNRFRCCEDRFLWDRIIGKFPMEMIYGNLLKANLF